MIGIRRRFLLLAHFFIHHCKATYFLGRKLCLPRHHFMSATCWQLAELETLLLGAPGLNQILGEVQPQAEKAEEEQTSIVPFGATACPRLQQHCRGAWDGSHAGPPGPHGLKGPRAWRIGAKGPEAWPMGQAWAHRVGGCRPRTPHKVCGGGSPAWAHGRPGPLPGQIRFPKTSNRG